MDRKAGVPYSQSSASHLQKALPRQIGWRRCTSKPSRYLPCRIVPSTRYTADLEHAEEWNIQLSLKYWRYVSLMAEHLHHCTMFFGAQSAQITSEPVWNPGTGLNLRTSWNKFKSGSLFSIFEPPGIGGRKSIGLTIASSRTISESIWVYLLGFHIGNLVNKWESTQLGKHQGYLWVHSSTNGELISWTGKLCFPLFTFGILWSHDSSCRTDAKVFHFNCSQETNYPTGESRRHYPNEIQRGMGHAASTRPFTEIRNCLAWAFRFRPAYLSRPLDK